MSLQALIKAGELHLRRGPGEVALADLVDDSRRASPGCAFVARRGGDADGRAFIADAVARGAVAVIGGADDTPDLPPGVAHAAAGPGVAVDQAFAGRLADAFFDRPASKLRLVGITGTNGKTTTAFILHHLLRHAGIPTGLVGTVVIDDGSPDGPRPAELTTPGAIEMHRLLARMVDHGRTAAVMEVSSHALHQGRTAGIAFDAAVFTNLTGDHLDYHGTMEDYADAKAILFDALDEDAWAIVNADNAYAQRMVRDCKARVIRTTLGDAEGVACRVSGVGLSADHSRATFEGPWGGFDARLPLVGRHNVANALQAVAATHALSGTNTQTLREALEQCPAVPGRLERVFPPSTLHAPLPTVFVDYAHSHDALKNVLEALRPLVRRELIVLIGCGGDRDKTKRPKMARVACDLADRAFFTADNPRTEDPGAIIEDMLHGVDRSQVKVIADRADAIRQCILSAEVRDTVLLAGKGHEDYQVIGREKRHFDDREHAAVALQRWQQEHETQCRLST